PPAKGLEELSALSLAPLQPHVPVPVVRPSTVGGSQRMDEFRALARAAESVLDAESARREGVALHALLQHLAGTAPQTRPEIAARAVAALLPDMEPRHARSAEKAISILARPELAYLFGPGSRAEVPFLANATQDGTPIRLAGRI